MAEELLHSVVELFRMYIQQQSWSIVEEKPVQNGLQLLVTDGEARTPVVCFTNGNALIQGATSSLKAQLNTWWKQRKALALQQEATALPPVMQRKISAFSEYAREQGWSYTGKEMHQGIYQLRFTQQTTTVPINFYPTGTVLIQGNPSDLKQQVEQWWESQQSRIAIASLWESAPASIEDEKPHQEIVVSPPQTQRRNEPLTAHIGTDEAGKGDYFGALVVAGVYVDEQQASQLQTVGVRDSKLLSDTAILSMAEDIKQICSPRHYQIIVYQPAQYNRLYQEIHNLNELLAKTHAQAIQRLQKETGCQFALVDQFAPEALLLQTLQNVACSITLEQRPRAEEDIAVAAASILARAEFVQQLAKLSKYAKTELPKGASSPDIVIIGRTIVAQFGQDMLRKLAKMHFKTTQAILQES